MTHQTVKIWRFNTFTSYEVLVAQRPPPPSTLHLFPSAKKGLVNGGPMNVTFLYKVEDKVLQVQSGMDKLAACQFLGHCGD